LSSVISPSSMEFLFVLGLEKYIFPLDPMFIVENNESFSNEIFAEIVTPWRQKFIYLQFELGKLTGNVSAGKLVQTQGNTVHERSVGYKYQAQHANPPVSIARKPLKTEDTTRLVVRSFFLYNCISIKR
jgi:hypothetical protein